MVGLVLALVVVCLVAAVAGAVVPGLFWLTLIALAGLLFTGAAGLALARPPKDDDASAAAPGAELRLISSHPTPHDPACQDGGEARRAA